MPKISKTSKICICKNIFKLRRATGPGCSNTAAEELHVQPRQAVVWNFGMIRRRLCGPGWGSHRVGRLDAGPSRVDPMTFQVRCAANLGVLNLRGAARRSRLWQATVIADVLSTRPVTPKVARADQGPPYLPATPAAIWTHEVPYFCKRPTESTSGCAAPFTRPLWTASVSGPWHETRLGAARK